MRTINRFLVYVVCALLCAPVAAAQDQQPMAKSRTGASQEVTIIIQRQQVSFTAPPSVEQMRLQVFDQSGELVFDSQLQSINQIDWPLQATTGGALKSGLYAYTLSIKDAWAPEPRLRRGHFIVDRAKDRDGADKLWVTSRNDDGVGAELTVARDETDTVAGATMSNDANDGGQRTIGQRTEIAGRDGADRAVDSEKQSQSKPEIGAGKEAVAAVAAGTVGQIAKFISTTDLGNSALTEISGNVGIGVANPTNRLHVLNTTPGTSAIFAVSASGPGVYGKSTSSRGVYGESDSFVGVYGSSGSGPGVIGASATGYGVQGTSASPTLFAGFFTNTGGGSGVYSESPTGRAIWGKSTSSRGVFGESDSNVGVWGASGSGAGVQGSSAGAAGLAGYFINTGGGSGVYSETTTGRAIWGKSVSSRGVFGESVSNVGVWGVSNSSTGVIGASTSGYGVDGSTASVNGFGGHFSNTAVGGIALKVDGIASVGVLEITNGSDFAENFEVSAEKRAGNSSASEIQPGLVVAIDPANPGKLELSHRAYDRRVAGIISGAGGVQPGMTMGQAQTLADGKYPVALSGRVYVWADATHGAIRPGDMLTTSTMPGHAMKVVGPAKAQGAIIGKAMTGLKRGKGLVLVLVTLQ
ncbi:MAG TPA: hypothetical protein VJ810_09355 [Blastocatellia bacterium]|nr:hypothetical protein [Blastocatellia bacterium]